MKMPFTVSARTAMLIGSENFSNPEGAIVELVKNTYDADSPSCYILFGKDENGKPCIYIADFGSGMTSKTISDCWMRIGTDDKLYNSYSASGRIKSGAKGIGRFALNRLGKRAEMMTFTKEEGGYKWSVDWNLFSQPLIDVSQVTADITEMSLTDMQSLLKDLSISFSLVLEEFTTGTILLVKDLNDVWDDVYLDHLFESLEDLIPPFNAPSFKICMKVLGKEQYGVVEVEPYEDYDYKVAASYSGPAKQEVTIRVYRNELDHARLFSEYRELFCMPEMGSYPLDEETFRKEFFELKMPVQRLRDIRLSLLSRNIDKLGAFQFDFFFVKSSISDNKGEDDLAKYPYRQFVAKDRRNWLKRNVGVKLYRDKFRVRPYGENGDDWLHLGDRYSANPIGAGQRLGGYHIRQNQIVGAVEISRIGNDYLQDKSGREGLQENEVVALFQQILLGIINEMERDRNTIMFSLSQLYHQRNPNGQKKEAADKALNSSVNEQAYNAIKEGYQVVKRELEEKESEMRLLRNLASTGLVITSFAHELRNIAILANTRSEDLREAIRSVISEDEAVAMGLNEYTNPFILVDDLKTQDSNIRSWLEFSINSVNRDKRTRKVFSLAEYFEKFKATWASVLDELNIKLIIEGFTEEMCVKAFIIDLDTVFNNLLSNAIYSIKERKSTTDRTISIIGYVNDSYFGIDFIDTGTGLSEQYRAHPNEIFNAFESSKFDKDGNKVGTGLGLYIVKTTLSEYRGWSISIIPNILNGFGLHVELKKY